MIASPFETSETMVELKWWPPMWMIRMGGCEYLTTSASTSVRSEVSCSERSPAVRYFCFVFQLVVTRSSFTENDAFACWLSASMTKIRRSNALASSRSVSEFPHSFAGRVLPGALPDCASS